MKIRLAIIPMVILSMLLSGVLCVNAEFSVGKDEEHCDITISEISGFSQVLVVDFIADDILKDGKKFSELSEEEQLAAINEHLIYVRQITDNTHKFRVNAPGAYTIFVNDGNITDSEEVVLIDPDFVSDYRTVAGEDAFVQLFDDSRPFMRVEISSFYKLDEIDRTTVAKRLFPKRADQTDMAAIKEKVELYTKLQNLVNEENEATVISDFNALSEEIGFDEFVKKEVYTKGTTAFKAGVIKRFAAYKADDKSEFNDAFTKSVLLEQVETAISSQVINQVASEIEQRFGVSSDKYKALGTDTSDVDNAVMKQNYNTVEDFVAALQTKSPTPDGGGGGGGSSSGSSNSNKSSSGTSITIKDDAPVKPQESSVNVAFYDVPETRWSYKSIDILNKKQVISGDGNGYFRPEDKITRAEFIKIAVSAFEMTYEDAHSNFSDVDISDWSYKYISSAYHFGIVKGKSDTQFAPNDTITREEAAVIAYNIVSFKHIPVKLSRDSAEFVDKSDISAWADEAVDYLYRCGILNGMGDDIFAPKNNITREQAATLVCSLFEAMV